MSYYHGLPELWWRSTSALVCKEYIPLHENCKQFSPTAETTWETLYSRRFCILTADTEDITAETLAGLRGVKPYNISAVVFKAETSMRPLEYIAKRRISQAKSLLLNTDSDIGDIGKQVGYEDRNYFSIVFKKLEGVSPREYRRSRGTGL